MPKTDGIELTIEDLQKAIEQNAVGMDVPKETEVGPLTEGSMEEMKFKPVYEQEREKHEREMGIRQPEPEPQPEQPVEQPQEVAEPEPQQEDRRALTPEELKNMVVIGKVNGEEREYTLDELLAVRQTQDAATHWLERAKAEFKAERDAFREQQQPQPQPVEEEYLTDEERRYRDIESQIKGIDANLQSFSQSQLANEEERYMRSVFEREGINEHQAGERLKQIVDAYPQAAIFASDLFSTNPKNADDLQKRKATFDTLWQLNKTIEMPQVVQRAKEEGANQAKLEAKQKITNVSGGAPVDTREPSRAEQIAQAAEGGTDDDWARLILQGPVLKNF